MILENILKDKMEKLMESQKKVLGLEKKKNYLELRIYHRTEKPPENH